MRLARAKVIYSIDFERLQERIPRYSQQHHSRIATIELKLRGLAQLRLLELPFMIKKEKETLLFS